METKLEKIEKDFEVPYSFDWTYGVTIGQIKEDIEKLEKLGVTRIDIDAYVSYDSPYVKIKAFCHRLETDAEFRTRIENENRHKAEVERYELEQLKKLKEKYRL